MYGRYIGHHRITIANRVIYFLAGVRANTFIYGISALLNMSVDNFSMPPKTQLKNKIIFLEHKLVIMMYLFAYHKNIRGRLLSPLSIIIVNHSSMIITKTEYYQNMVGSPTNKM